MAQTATPNPVASLPPAASAQPKTQTSLDKLEGATSLLAPDAKLVLVSLPDAAKQKAGIATPPLPFARFATAFVDEAPTAPRDVRLEIPVRGAVAPGETLVASFYLRGQGKINPITGRPRVTLALEPVAGFVDEGRAYSTFLTQDPRANTPPPVQGWRRFVVPFAAPQGFAPGSAKLSFYLGHAAQTIEIGGVQLQSFGNRVLPNEIETLPRRPSTPRYGSPFAYDDDSRNANAPWRLAANARIEKIRKGNLKIEVRDARNRPVSGATVRIEMTRHAFPFGTAVSAKRLLAPGEDNDKYREIVSSWFNHAVTENDLKWRQWEENSERAQQALGWLHARGIPTRGHTLVWGSWRYLPSTLR